MCAGLLLKKRVLPSPNACGGSKFSIFPGTLILCAVGRGKLALGPLFVKIEKMTEQETVTTEVNASVNPLERSLDLVISNEELNALVAKKLKEFGKNAKMPGFRKGHVPADRVQMMYGAEAFDRAVNELVSAAWVKAADESGLRIVGYPRIDATQSEDKDNMHFKAVFEVFPEVEIPSFADVELKRYVCPVTDAEVEKTIDVMRRQRATYNVVERAAQNDDSVKINFRGTKDGEAFAGGTAEGYQFVLGQGRMLPEFEAAVLGMSAGEKKTFPLTFPADYGVKDLEGQTVEFEIDMLEVSEPVYPEVNDEFAQSLGVEAGVEAMRNEIRSNLEREVKMRLEMRTKSEVMDKVAGVVNFSVPTAMVDDEAQNLAQQMLRDLQARGIDTKKIPAMPADTFKAQAERRVRLGLFVDALLRQEQIAGTDEQVKALAEEIAASYEDPSEVVSYILKDANRVNNLKSQATENNVTEWVLSHAKTVEETVDFDQLMAGQFA